MLFSAVSDTGIPLIDLVIRGDKTQTRRPCKTGEGWPTDKDDHDIVGEAVLNNKGIKWMVGRNYAVQPRRGKPSIARIRLLSIRLEDVRHISDDDAKAEGFSNKIEFWKVWRGLYDPHRTTVISGSHLTGDSLFDRPAELYQAWALTFEAVK